MPTWDPRQKYPPLKFEKYIDPGSRADPSFPNLFPKDGDYKVTRITPKFGTEVDGIQLSQLNDAAKDELALYLAQRKVLLFNDQDFADKGQVLPLNLGNTLEICTFTQVQVHQEVTQSCTLPTEDQKRVS